MLAFASGPLLRALGRRLGNDTATEVLGQVRSILQRAATRVSFAPARTSRPPVDDESGVYVARRTATAPAPGAAGALASRLAGSATVRVVEGLLELLDALHDDDDGAPRVVAIDGARPSVQVPSIATVVPDLARAEIVVWRASAGDRAAIDPHVASWRACPGSVDDLAATCARALLRRD